MRCLAPIRYPAVGTKPAQEEVCGYLMTIRRGNISQETSGSGTSGLFRHLKETLEKEFTAIDALSSHSTTGKRKRADIVSGVSRNQKKGKGAITALLHRPLSLEQQQEQDRRSVAMCAVDLLPYNMSATAAFQRWLGGYSPELVKKTTHRTTINKNLESLCADVRAVMTAKLAAHYEFVKKRGWTGPWISMQCDATSTNNTEYYTVSFSWVPEDWSGMERVEFCKSGGGGTLAARGYP